MGLVEPGSFPAVQVCFFYIIVFKNKFPLVKFPPLRRKLNDRGALGPNSGYFPPSYPQILWMMGNFLLAIRICPSGATSRVHLGARRIAVILGPNRQN